MFRKQDPYSYIQTQTLYVSDASGNYNPIGVLLTDYQVTLYNDVQVLNQGSVNQQKNQQFILTCTQRILLKNKNSFSMNPESVGSESNEDFANYPALFETSIKIGDAENHVDGGVTYQLLEYSPQTVNTAVQQNTAVGTSSGTNTTNSSTTGNTYSQSNTYGASVSLGEGFSGVTASYEHSSTKTKEKSNTNSNESSAGAESSTSDSMSIKDWGSYASVDPRSQYPLWVFGQEFPWNSIECRFTKKNATNENNHNQEELYISKSMQSNLYDGVFLYPPSELSMYGVNFVMKVCWRFYVNYGSPTEITINHPIDYYTASHTLVSDGSSYTPVVYMDRQSTSLMVKSDGTYDSPSITLDLNIMGLDPIGVNSDAAVIGFIPSRFIPEPTSSEGVLQVAKRFRTLATTNDLMIQDTTDYPTSSSGDEASSGFTASQTCLTAAWNSTQNFAYRLTVYFKIIDSVNEYKLYIKHWKSEDTAVKLTIQINEDENSAITKYVNSKEAEGGEDNILCIALRDLDFASVDYHDYLQLGLNSVVIKMEPMDDDWENCGYQIRAISVTKG